MPPRRHIIALFLFSEGLPWAALGLPGGEARPRGVPRGLPSKGCQIGLRPAGPGRKSLSNKHVAARLSSASVRARFRDRYSTLSTTPCMSKSCGLFCFLYFRLLFCAIACDAETWQLWQRWDAFRVLVLWPPSLSHRHGCTGTHLRSRPPTRPQRRRSSASVWRHIERHVSQVVCKEVGRAAPRAGVKYKVSDFVSFFYSFSPLQQNLSHF